MFPYNSRQNPLDGSLPPEIGNNHRGSESQTAFPQGPPNQSSSRLFYEPSDNVFQFQNDSSVRYDSRNLSHGFEANFQGVPPYSAPPLGNYSQGSPRTPLAPPQTFDQMYGPPVNQFSNFRRQEAAESIVYVVEFKRNSGDYVIGYRAHIYSALNVSDAVIVACEKGENLGIVTQVLTMNEYLMMKYNTTAINPADISKYFGRIIRVASRQELIALQQKDADEREIVQYCQNLAYSPAYRLNIRIVDAEFQFDRMKLTIYYESNGRVDFRDYVKTLYTSLQVRVWMEKI